MPTRPLVLVPILLLASRAIAADPAPDPALVAPTQKISRALPPNWNARIDGDTIYIEYQQVVEMYSTAPNQGGGPDQPKIFQKPTLVLRSLPFTTKATLAEITQKNADRAKALEMLASQMKDLVPQVAMMPMADDTDGFRATTPDQQARLDAYVAVSRALPHQDPPTLFDVNVAFLWGWSYTQPADSALRKDLADLQVKIESLFNKEPLK